MHFEDESERTIVTLQQDLLIRVSGVNKRAKVLQKRIATCIKEVRGSNEPSFGMPTRTIWEKLNSEPSAMDFKLLALASAFKPITLNQDWQRTSDCLVQLCFDRALELGLATSTQELDLWTILEKFEETMNHCFIQADQELAHLTTYIKQHENNISALDCDIEDQALSFEQSINDLTSQAQKVERWWSAGVGSHTFNETRALNAMWRKNSIEDVKYLNDNWFASFEAIFSVRQGYNPSQMSASIAQLLERYPL
ncbi:hypothetical protein BDP27DRAFT_1371073 [Rhodocollybia butyracea]|uniref:Uncharacterized protein n=1 Tax=Rhodocollybia butyracea TaxID=206335 RepID=A0A9P5TYZ7_9AGAR|nr:hypothetical protein BDP27DRAFT_1371073 [Rhodocollybia butyracea]